MRNLIILIVIFAVVGLVVGYLMFGRQDLTNELIPIGRLFASDDTWAGDAVLRELRAGKRQNIYIAGAVGAGIGLVLGFALNRRRR